MDFLKYLKLSILLYTNAKNIYNTSISSKNSISLSSKSITYKD